MRELKFRVWDSKLKKFRGGRLSFYSGSDTLFSSASLDAYGWSIPETDLIIQQFTGYKDIHGKDIYDGDIVCALSSDNKYNSIVQWDGIEGRWGFVSIKSKNMSYNYNLGVGCSKWAVVGNIFENPELL
jgi:uncharacterized phage protein (TIGR01671 family)